MTSIVIRPAEPQEYDEIARLWLVSWESTGLGDRLHVSLADLRARIPREIANGWELFVAVDGPRLAAMLAMRSGENHLDQLFVAPDFQGKGVGKALLAFARSTMPDEIWLRTMVENTPAACWYEREGFVLERVELPEGATLKRAYYRWKRP